MFIDSSTTLNARSVRRSGKQRILITRSIIPLLRTEQSGFSPSGYKHLTPWGETLESVNESGTIQGLCRLTQPGLLGTVAQYARGLWRLRLRDHVVARW